MTGTILIYANCQGEELMLTGGYLPSLADRIAFRWIPYHLTTEADWDARYGPGFMADTTEVWEQTESAPPTPNRMQLHARIPDSASIVRFPALSAQCLWPLAGNDPRAAADPQRYPWGDAVAALLAGSDLPDDELFAEYIDRKSTRLNSSH